MPAIDVEVKRYSTLRFILAFEESEGVPLDLSEATHLQGWLSTSPGGPVVAASVTVSDAAAGEITVLWTDSQIGALAPGRYPWEVWLQLPTSEDHISLGGTVSVVPAVRAPVWT